MVEILSDLPTRLEENNYLSTLNGGVKTVHPRDGQNMKVGRTCCSMWGLRQYPTSRELATRIVFAFSSATLDNRPRAVSTLYLYCYLKLSSPPPPPGPLRLYKNQLRVVWLERMIGKEIKKEKEKKKVYYNLIYLVKIKRKSQVKSS